MKKSGKVGLVLLAALGLASCTRRQQATMVWDDVPRDPCSQEYFDETLCRSAVSNRGYHYGGHWHPMVYSNGYSHYYDRHQSFLNRGGTYVATPREVYSAGFKAPTKGTVVRGGFGTTARSFSYSSSGTSSRSSYSSRSYGSSRSSFSS
jgi:hypothetical protein